GTRDRQPEPHAVPLRREERVEQALDDFGAYAGSGVVHHDLDAARVRPARPHPQLPPRRRHAFHRVDGVQYQVQHDLLQMDLVAAHDRQLAVIGFRRDAVPAEIGGDETEHVRYRPVEIEGLNGQLPPAQERAHMAYDLARPHVIVAYVIDDLPQLLDRDRFPA